MPRPPLCGPSPGPVTHDQCPHGMLTQQTPEILLDLFKAQAIARLGQREGAFRLHLLPICPRIAPPLQPVASRQ